MSDRAWFTTDKVNESTYIISEYRHPEETHCYLLCGSDSEEYELFQGVPGRLLDDGDIIELGDRNIKAIHTPGHSPGHMCFWDETNQFMFTGDLIYKGFLYANYPSTDSHAYLGSVKKVSTYKSARIFPGHHSLDVSTGLVGRIKNVLQKLDDDNLLYHGSGIFDYEDWSILL